MKTYKVGEDILYRPEPTGTRQWGTVRWVEPEGTDAPAVYWVQPDGQCDNTYVGVTPDRIVDLAQVGADASAALKRIRRQTEARAALLDYLLGELQAYADRDGDIRYTVESVIGDRPRKARHSLREIVDRYVAKRQATYGA